MAVKFPASSDEVKAAGYVYDNDANCRGCGAPIEWWITPNGAKMSMTVKKAGDPLFVSAEVREPHFTDCPEAGKFRKRTYAERR